MSETHYNERVEREQIAELRTHPQYAALFCGKDNTITTWPGTVVGSYRIVSGWKHNGWTAHRRYAIRATVFGREYHGKTFGEGMFVSLKRCK